MARNILTRCFKGASIRQKRPEIFQYYEAWPVKQKAPVFTIHVLAWNGPTLDNPSLPRYDDRKFPLVFPFEPSLTKLTLTTIAQLHVTELHVNLNKIPQKRLPKGYNSKMNGLCFECFLDIKIAYGSAGLEYSLWHKGVKYGGVEAKYS